MLIAIFTWLAGLRLVCILSVLGQAGADIFFSYRAGHGLHSNRSVRPSIKSKSSAQIRPNPYGNHYWIEPTFFLCSFCIMTPFKFYFCYFLSFSWRSTSFIGFLWYWTQINQPPNQPDQHFLGKNTDNFKWPLF